MDYTDDICMNLFTEGQKLRMRTIIENSPRRTSLISSPGLTEPVMTANDLAITKVIAPQYYECDNVIVPSIQVTNHGSNTINSYEVTLSANNSLLQTINMSTMLEKNQFEVVLFTSEVISFLPTDIKFVISNVNGITDGNPSNDVFNLSLLKTSSISLPFVEDFESGINIFEQNGASFPWQVSSAAKETSTNKAMQFKAFQNTTAFGDNTVLKTPVFDLTGINSAQLKFSYSHAPLIDGFQDGLSIKVSTDCGKTFSDNLIFNKYGPNLATSAKSASSFVPSNAQEWEIDSISITQFKNIDGVQFAFVGQNGGGNNIYIDDISILQTEINAMDASLISVDAPLVTCAEMTSVNAIIRNVGFQNITQIKYQYNIGTNSITKAIGNLSLLSGEYQALDFDLTLTDGLNELDLTIIEVNGLTDGDPTNNSASLCIDKNTYKDSYPLLVDFETPNFWKLPTGQSQIWSNTMIGSNNVLLANAFSQTETGTKSWFVSPVLDIGSEDSAGLSFKVSYAKRMGFNDRLQVLMSINCGESYTFELLNADSDSLSITTNEGSWLPNSDEDWKEFKIDLKSSIAWKDDIRIVFVFINGNGNNLYIDDINIGTKPELDDENKFVVFPNPANAKFNIAFFLEERDDIQIHLIDISGRVIFTQQYKNVLDQVYDFEALFQDGFYFVKVTSESINQIERLYIRR